MTPELQYQIFQQAAVAMEAGTAAYNNFSCVALGNIMWAKGIFGDERGALFTAYESLYRPDSPSPHRLNWAYSEWDRDTRIIALLFAAEVLWDQPDFGRN